LREKPEKPENTEYFPNLFAQPIKTPENFPFPPRVGSLSASRAIFEGFCPQSDGPKAGEAGVF
jgi:hypothetical protein